MIFNFQDIKDQSIPYYVKKKAFIKVKCLNETLGLNFVSLLLVFHL